jgi:hypothetical protein
MSGFIEGEDRYQATLFSKSSKLSHTLDRCGRSLCCPR